MGVMGQMRRRLVLCVCASGLLLLAGQGAKAQTAGATNGGGNSASGASSSSNLGAVQQVQQQLSQPGPNVSPGGTTDQSFRGSVIREKATGGVMSLTLEDAMQRGLRNN